MLIKNKSGKHAGQWLLVLGAAAIDGALCLVLAEGTLLKGTKDNNFTFKSVLHIDDVAFAHIWDSGDWEACTFEFHSPAFLRLIFNVQDFSGVQIVATWPPISLFEAAGCKGFGKLSQATMKRLARHKHIEMPHDGDLFDVVLTLLKAALPAKTFDADIVDILGSRFIGKRDIYAGAIDAELLAMGPADNQSMEDEGFTVEEKADDDESHERDAKTKFVKFRKEHREKHAAAPKAKAGAKGAAAKAKAKPGGAASGSKVEKRKPTLFPGVSSTLTEEEFGQLLPDDYKPWKDDFNKRWKVTLFKAHVSSKSWLKYGFQESAKLAAAEAWQHSAETFETVCPYTDLALASALAST